ncbi:MAG: winged helix-turn-helix domain-containing protein, partial [Pseudoalteromonas spongiae]
MTITKECVVYCFAEFTFIPDTACLNTPSEQVRLRNKVALLLAYFLQHPNEVISKERLLSELWQHGDFREASLTQSIRELRAVLGDDAKSPRFIETIPQRGYRWICPLKVTSKSHHSKSANASKQNIFASTKRLIFVGLCGLVAASIWSATRYFADDVMVDKADTQPHIQQQVESLIVLPFSNNTGKADMAWLELGLSDMLSVDLKRANQVQIVSPAQG